jgi:hypothetical protein
VGQSRVLGLDGSGRETRLSRTRVERVHRQAKNEEKKRQHGMDADGSA